MIVKYLAQPTCTTLFSITEPTWVPVYASVFYVLCQCSDSLFKILPQVFMEHWFTYFIQLSYSMCPSSQGFGVTTLLWRSWRAPDSFTGCREGRIPSCAKWGQRRKTGMWASSQGPLSSASCPVAGSQYHPEIENIKQPCLWLWVHSEVASPGSISTFCFSRNKRTATVSLSVLNNVN